MSNANQQFYANLLGVGLEEYEPNEVKLQNSSMNDTIVIDMFRDCTIRAISKMLGKSWEEVFQDIMTIGLSEQTFHLNHMVKTYLENHGYKEVKNIDTDITVGEFIYCHKRQSDQLIVTSKNHVAAVKGGVIYDSPRCIKYVDQFLLSRLQSYFSPLFCFIEDGVKRYPDIPITITQWDDLPPSERWQYDSKNWSKEPTGICDRAERGIECCSKGENGYCYYEAGTCSSQLKMDGSGEMNDEMKNAIIEGIAMGTGKSEEEIRKQVEGAWKK